MDAAGASLKRIEEAMAHASTPLARALAALGEANRGRGTCLVLEHEDFGEVLIADRFWTRGREETLRDRARLSLVDLSQDGAFHRAAVLVEPSGDERRLDEGALALTLAALEVTSALAAIAAPAVAAAGELAPLGPVRREPAVPRLPPPRPETMMRDEGVWGI